MGRSGKARRKPHAVSKSQVQTQWGIITYTAGSAMGSGYFLDKFVAGERSDAEFEAAAARNEGVIGKYSTTFVVPLTHGFMQFTRERAVAMDVWLYRRRLADRNEYMVKVTKALDVPVAPPESEEWEAILIAAHWQAPAHAPSAPSTTAKTRRPPKDARPDTRPSLTRP